MNVASLELCKELYELSGWKEGLSFYIDSFPPSSIMTISEYGNTVYTPAYDSGFLLRKLPGGIKLRKDSNVNGLIWRVETAKDSQDLSHGVMSDVLEDALCSLAINLFKKGILRKDK